MNYSSTFNPLDSLLSTYSVSANMPNAITTIEKLRYDGAHQYLALLLLATLKNSEPDALSLLGDCYYQGVCVKKDIDKSHSLFSKALQNGSKRANYDLAWYYYDKDEYVRAIEYFQLCISLDAGLADDVICKSHRCLGNSYSYLPSPDMHRAVEHWTIAADKYHDAISCRQLGIWYSKNENNQICPDKCLYYLKEAATQKDTYAAHKLALFYLFGEEALDILPNVRLAESILLPLSTTDDVDILSDLGLLYREGDLKDLAKAKIYLERAWQLSKRPLIAADLGYTYFLLNDYRSAEPLLKIAADEGINFFADFLGRIYKDGLAGHEDPHKAAHYYEQAYKTNSLNNIYTHYEYAELLVELNNYEHAYTVSKSGEQEYNDICFYFISAKLIVSGLVYDNQSIEESLEILEECIERDHHALEANMLLGVFYKKSNRLTRAVKHYTQAFNLGNPDAAVYIGRIYEQGGGSITADVDVAYSWYEKAANAGSQLGRSETQCFSKTFFGKYKRIRSI